MAFNPKPPVFGTAIPQATGLIPKDVRTEKEKCEAKGGTWDTVTNTCILLEKKKKVLPKKPTPPSPPGTVVKDAETGVIKGFINSSGDFVSAPAKETQKIIARQQARKIVPPGAQTTEEFQESQALQQKIAGFGLTDQEIAALQSLPAEQASIDWSQAITAGTIGNVPSILGGIASGAGAGALAGAGIGVVGGPLAPVSSTVGAVAGGVIGGVFGLIKGVWGGVQRNIDVQQTGEIGASKDVLTNAKTNMMKLSRLAMTDPSHADDYIAAYDFWLAEVYKARRQIKLETQGDLNSFMEDGRDILSDFDLFLLPDVGTAAIYKQRIIAALNQEVSPEMILAQMMEEEA